MGIQEKKYDRRKSAPGTTGKMTRSKSTKETIREDEGKIIFLLLFGLNCIGCTVSRYL